MKKPKFETCALCLALSAAVAWGAAWAEEIILPAGSDQCQSEPADLVHNMPVGAVRVIDIPASEATNPPPLVFAGEFTYVVFGDTQDYHDDGSSNPSFESRVSWVIEQKDQRNIKFVSHLGDVVNDLTSENELEFAKTQLERLHEARIPCAFAPGNHDMVWGDTKPITDHLDSERLNGELESDLFDGFPGHLYSKLAEIPRRYTDREADHAEINTVAGCGANSYQILNYGDGRYIFIHLQCSVPTNVLKWVDQVLDDNPDRLAIIVEHEGLGDVNAKLPFNSEEDRLNMGRMRASRITSNGSTSAQYQWERCFSRHPNVLMILSGHENELLSGIRTSRGLYGNDVVEINQSYPEFSCSDWLRTYAVNPEKQKITVYTYSPQQNVLCTGRGREFDKSKSGLKEDYQFATNCPHHFTIDYGRLRAGVSASEAGITFRTVTDEPLKDGSQVNGRELYQSGFAFSGLATYPIVSRVDVSRAEGQISIRYFLVNDYELTSKGGTLRVLGVVRPRVVLTQGVTAAEVTDALEGDLIASGGGWYEVRVPVQTAAERLGVAADDLTDVVATVATVPEGTPSAPWTVGKDVTAYLEDGVLFVKGTGAMVDFASAADAPWAPVASRISRVEVAPTVTQIGEHAFDDVPANVPLALTESQMPRASGAISGAEFDKVAIMDGKAYLDVSVYTSDAITNQNWSVATNGVIEVPAPGKQGFFYLMSKPGVPSDRGGAIVTGPTFTPGK